MNTTREVQTEEKADSWMKEVESSSIPGQNLQHRSSNVQSREGAESSSGECSSLPSHHQPPSSCKGLNIKCKVLASSECEASGTRGSVAKAANGVRGKSEGGSSARSGKAGHQRRLVINLDDKNKFTEEVTV